MNRNTFSLFLASLTLLVSLLVPASTAADIGILDKLSSLTQKLGMGSTEKSFLHPDKAFILSTEVNQGGQAAVVRWAIADGYYLYQDKFEFKFSDNAQLTIGNINLPPGKKKTDESFGDSIVYYSQVAIKLPLNRVITEQQSVQLEVRYQGCADAGFCYPPITKTIPINLPVITHSSQNTTSSFINEQDTIANQLQSSSLIQVIVLFFGFGLLLAFTPCVLPMVPILSSLIISKGHKTSTKKAFSLSLVYVLAMATTYTFAGMLAGLYGQNLQTTFQNPWVISAFSLLFVILALSMFGFYSLQMPTIIQHKLNNLSNHQQGGSYIGAGIMGLLSALIVGPCITAPLVGALAYIGQTGDAALGGIALFSLSMGMGTPLLAVGASAGKWLPKAGPWMSKVNTFFGVLLLGLAIWMLERIIPAQATLLLWGALLVVSAVYMHAFDRLPQEISGWDRLTKGVGLFLFAYGIILIIGAAGGGKNVFQPLKGSFLSSQNQTSSQHLSFTPIKGLAGLNEQLAIAKSQSKPVLVDFYADWCVSCKEMDALTFADAGVQSVLESAVLLQADVTANDEKDQQLLKHYGIFGPPSIMFYNALGEERKEYRLVGFLGPNKFEEHAKIALDL